MAATILALFVLLVSNAQAQCSWSITDENNNQQNLDLSCLKSRMLNTGDETNHNYAWSVCTNGNSCNGDQVMVAQTGEAGDCFILGRWDQTISPSYTSIGGGTWSFQYDNGDTDCGNPARTWAPTFICDRSTEYQVSDATEVPNSCFYEVTVRTRYACGGGPFTCSGDDDASGLSGGWVFIIILLSALFLYCAVGYIVMATTVNKAGGFADFGNNIPQSHFWSALPKLVLAGCAVTKETIMGLINKGKGGDEPLVTDGDE